jgi:hypothetical protein
MRHAGLAPVACSFVLACAPDVGGERVVGEREELVASTRLGPICAREDDRALHRDGVAYLALCPTGEAEEAEIVRVDLVTGAAMQIGTYAAGRQVTFEDVGPRFALWSINGADHVVSVWDGDDRGIGTRAVAMSRALSSNRRIAALGYAGAGRVVVAWDTESPKIGVVDVRTRELVEQTAAGPLVPATFPEKVHRVRSSEGQRWQIGASFVDVGGPLRVVPFPAGYRASELRTWDRYPSAWDGTEILLVEEEPNGPDRYAAFDPRTGENTFVGRGTTDPVFGRDGWMARYDVEPDGHAGGWRRQLTVARGGTPGRGRAVAGDFRGIAYVAPGGSWVIALGREPASAESRAWLVDMTGEALVPLAHGSRSHVVEEDGVVTLAMVNPGDATLVRITRDRSIGRRVHMTAEVQLLTSDRLLVDGCAARFDGAEVTVDRGDCLAPEDRTSWFYAGRAQHEVIHGARRLAVWTEDEKALKIFGF